MEVEPTSLPDVLLIKPRVFADERGFFLESYRRERYRELGITGDFVQDNHSRSARGTLRGMHYQLNHPQGKLVQVTRGEVFDVAVDLRKNSPTFGRWTGVILSDENHHQLYVPPGFAHGFCVLSETADFVYKCTEIYHPQDEHVLLWNDPAVGIEWPLAAPLLSAKDQQGKPLVEVPYYP